MSLGKVEPGSMPPGVLARLEQPEAFLIQSADLELVL